MSEDKDDIVNVLEEAGKEPKDESPDRGFVAIGDNGEPIKLDEEPEKTKDSTSEES